MEILVFVWLMCAGFAAYVAGQKGRSSAGWFALGLFFGVFALAAIAAVPVLAKPVEPKLDFNRAFARKPVGAEAFRLRAEPEVAAQ